jgi:hypothetical protein
MNETKRFCSRCHQLVDFTVVEGRCLQCGQQLTSSETADGSDGKKSEVRGCLHTIFVVLLVLLAIFLVFLAVVYAACSRMGPI